MTDQSRDIISAVNERPPAYDESKYRDHLIEQYKLYVGMTDQLSARRILVNNGFTALIGASAVAYSAAPSYFRESGFDAPFQIGIALAAFVFAILWRQTMIHYKELSRPNSPSSRKSKNGFRRDPTPRNTFISRAIDWPRRRGLFRPSREWKLSSR